MLFLLPQQKLCSVSCSPTTIARLTSESSGIWCHSLFSSSCFFERRFPVTNGFDRILFTAERQKTFGSQTVNPDRRKVG